MCKGKNMNRDTITKQKQNRKSVRQKAESLKKIIKLMSIAILTKIQRRNKTTNIRNQIEDITKDLAASKKIIRTYYHQICAHELGNK